ncbi:MAG: 50S ribosomal protein L24 [Nitrospinae bacterium]|nr:50S ribosomal protein L24 [Nitrospinota bacterium]MBI3813619.1 50S ribosomal protein L24 [Nitrospinota bacterium]
MNQLARVKIKKNDIVKVITGKEAGKKGKILMVFPGEQRVVVEKLNIVKRHTRPTQKVRQGGIIEKEGRIHISNVMLVCNKCDKTTRVAMKILENGKKVRTCKKCGEILDRD